MMEYFYHSVACFFSQTYIVFHLCTRVLLLISLRAHFRQPFCECCLWHVWLCRRPRLTTVWTTVRLISSALKIKIRKKQVAQLGKPEWQLNFLHWYFSRVCNCHIWHTSNASDHFYVTPETLKHNVALCAASRSMQCDICRHWLILW